MIGSSYLGRAGLLAAVILGLVGCGYPHCDLHGTVTYNGKPLDKDGGVITFRGPDGIAVAAPIDRSGNYLAKGVCLGENTVAVVYSRPTATPTKRAPGSPDGGMDPDKSQNVSPYWTPESYALPETSKLWVIVEKDIDYNPNLEGPIIP